MSGIGWRLEATVLGGPQAPTAQKMDRGGGNGYDPLRIPFSVFEESRSTTPTDWSSTSNDSLFSINVGTNSSIFLGDRPALLRDLPELEEPVQNSTSEERTNDQHDDSDTDKVVKEEDNLAKKPVDKEFGQSQSQSGQDPKPTAEVLYNSSTHSGISTQLSCTFSVLEDGTKGESMRSKSDRSSPKKKKKKKLYLRAICQTAISNPSNQWLSCGSSWRSCLFCCR